MKFKILKVRNLAVIFSSFVTALFIVFLLNNFAVIKFKSPEPSFQYRHEDQDDTPPDGHCRKLHDRDYVVDDEGRVCKWLEVDYITGCCPAVDQTDHSLHCKDNCCKVYAFCISSCLDPQIPIHSNFSTSDIRKFDYCTEICRTNSKSIINENQWKSDLKYCYPTEATTKEVTDEQEPSNIEYAIVSKDQISDISAISDIKSQIEATFLDIESSTKKQEQLFEQLESTLYSLNQQNVQLSMENRYLIQQLTTLRGKLNLKENSSPLRFHIPLLLLITLICLLFYFFD
eukprot:TRINITY_DN5490_c0_g1_i2.p1 TRINITY_DN5490_c0_g1~~TRINITY_DN5490_c0_g1_i2.p1  ORF type:complete len:287 (-),score=39.43 TRINITY_DN5490_c0_g1_i2:23-883(-)